MKNKGIFRISIIFLLFSLLFTSSSLAYVKFGGKWLGSDNSYYLDASVASYGYTSITQYGASQWYDYGHIVMNQTTNAEYAKIKVYAGDFHISKWADTLNYKYNFFGNLEACWDCNYGYSRVRINDPILGGEESFDAKKVLTHEFGHVIGLDHSNVTPSIMLQGYLLYNTLRPDDIAGRDNIY